MSTTPVDRAEARRLATIELVPSFRAALWLRAGAAPVVAALGVIFLLHAEPWRGLSCLAVAAAVFVLSVLELLGRVKILDMRPSTGRRGFRRQVVVFGSSVLAVHFTLILVSGGLHSPWVIILPMVGFFQGVVIGRRRLALAGGSMISAFACALAVLALRAPSIELGVFSRGPAPLALVIALALVVAILPMLAAIVGMRLRQALERAVASAAESKSLLLRATQERNEELHALAGALAHELKNPLAAIRGLASLQARKLEQGSKQAEQMRVLLQEVARMGGILDELSNFSRPARGLAIETVDPARVVREIVGIHEPLAAERGVRLTCHLDEAGPLVCDPRKLKQILVNLLQNAIDASERGGHVSTRVSSGDDGCSFQIEDRGSGLADAVRGRLFTPGATTKLAGSGLGLTIARAIAEQHGGTLTLSERDGGGCAAELRLPARPPPGDDQEPS